LADTAIAITAGTGTNVDTRTEATNGNHRQVIVIGDPSTNAGVAPVDATTGLAVNVTNASLTVASHAVTNAGTFAVQAAATLAAETTKVIGTVNVAAAQTLATVTTVGAVTAITNALPAGTNAIGKLAANSGVDIGDVDVTSLPALAAGSNLIGKVDVQFAGTVPDTGSGTGGTKTQRVIVDSSQFSSLGQTTASASAPVVIASDQSAVKTNPVVSATANGGTASRINSAASNNLTSVKASAGQLYTIDVFNVAAYNVFLKLYNKASAPVVASDTPVMTIPIQAGGGYSKTWTMGLPFSTGIAYAIVKLQADTDNTNVVAGDLTGNILWI
jgi:hypothetical protein